MNEHTIPGLRNVIRAIEQTAGHNWSMQHWWDTKNECGCAIGNYVHCGLARALHFRWPQFQLDPGRAQFEVCAMQDGVLLANYDAVGAELGLTRDECIKLFSQFSYSDDGWGVSKGEVIEAIEKYIEMLESKIPGEMD